jgi:hypothetical protein
MAVLQASLGRGGDIDRDRAERLSDRAGGLLCGGHVEALLTVVILRVNRAVKKGVEGKCGDV